MKEKREASVELSFRDLCLIKVTQKVMINIALPELASELETLHRLVSLLTIQFWFLTIYIIITVRLHGIANHIINI